jgi:hypothetical protein
LLRLRIPPAAKELAQRNLTNDQRAYLVGKRYEVEKKEPVRPKLGNKVATIANLPPINRPTENIIADQSNVSPRLYQLHQRISQRVQLF